MLHVIDEVDEGELNDEDKSDDPDTIIEDNTECLKEPSRNQPHDRDLSILANRLLEEFESLGFYELTEKTNVTVDALTYAFRLLNAHRKLLLQAKNSNVNAVKLNGEISKLEKQRGILEQAMNDKEVLIDSLNKKLLLRKLECDDLRKENLTLQQEVRCRKKLITTKESEWEHRVRQLQAENQHLRELSEKSIGSYTNKDVIIASVIQKYKSNEDHYKEIIKKLQENNQGLIKQLLSLLHNSNTSSNVQS